MEKIKVDNLITPNTREERNVRFLIPDARSTVNNYIEKKNNRSITDTDLNEIIVLVKEIFKRAIEELYIFDKSLIYNQQSERCICAKLAYYLQEVLFVNHIYEYYADVEYIRLKENDKNSNKIYCDLIIHTRNTKPEVDNLFAVEMKRLYNTKGKDEDIDRLITLTSPQNENTPKNAVCGTLLGLFLQVQKTQYKTIWIEQGEIQETTTIKIKREKQ